MNSIEESKIEVSITSIPVPIKNRYDSTSSPVNITIKNRSSNSPSPTKNRETISPKKGRQLKNHVHVSVRLKPIKADVESLSPKLRKSFDRNKHWKVLNEN